MAKQVPWTKRIVEEFISEAMLTETEERILRTRIAGWSTTKQAVDLNMSVASINRIIANLKQKYDEVQPYSDILPERKGKGKKYKRER